jgi:hypothetical protein
LPSIILFFLGLPDLMEPVSLDPEQEDVTQSPAVHQLTGRHLEGNPLAKLGQLLA